MTEASTGDRAAAHLRDRLTHEIGTKDSIDRRGQFLVGTAAASGTLLAAAYGAYVRGGNEVSDCVQFLGSLSFIADTAVVIYGLLATRPRKLDAPIDHDLEAYVAPERFEDDKQSSTSAANIALVELKYLLSLVETNKRKAHLVVVGTILQAIATILLATTALVAIATS